MQATPNLNPVIKESLLRLGAQYDYQSYFLLTNSKAQAYRHTEYICGLIQKIIDGEQHFYIVELPPQHGKSMTIT